MSCHRCHGLMYPDDLLIGASGGVHDNVRAWRCVICGEIVDQVIVQNRIQLKKQRWVKRKKRPRQTVPRSPVF